MFRGLDQALKAMRVTWRFMGSYEWVYKSPNMGQKYSYPTYNPTSDNP